jgi:hypothetical protein
MNYSLYPLPKLKMVAVKLNFDSGKIAKNEPQKI